MVKMVPYEAFTCPCGVGDVVLRESLAKTLSDVIFLWKEERVRLLVGSPGASTTPIYSPGSSSTPIYSPRSSTTLIYSLGSSSPPRYSPGALTPHSYSSGTSRNAECSNFDWAEDVMVSFTGVWWLKSSLTSWRSKPTFTARSPDNTPLANRASTSANLDPMISTTFVEANYEVLESLLMDRRRQIRNKDLYTKLDHYSQEYDEEREIEPRPVHVRETTRVLRIGSPRVQRHRGRVVEFKDALNRHRTRVEREFDGRRPSRWRAEDGGSRGVNLPPLHVAHLGRSENGQPLQSILTFWYGGNQPSTNSGGNLHPNSLFVDYTGCVTPFVRWIEDYPLPDGLKMLSHVCSYDGKGDLDNYLHLFKCVIRMPKWAMPIAFHMFTYTLKDSAWIWWNGQKVRNDTLQILGLHKDQRISGFVHGLKTRSLVEFLSTDLPITYKGLMEKTYTWIEAKEVSTNGAPNDYKEGFDRFNKGFS
ncbi:hypothetical protein Tco_1311041 [Tanacetum coccineum]